MLRRIPLDGVKNVRDLGGYPIGKTQMTKYRVFFRSALPDALTDSDIDRLRELGITASIDLRAPRELLAAPSVLASCDGIDYHNLHLAAPDKASDESHKIKPAATRESLIESYYSHTLAPIFANIFRIFAENDGAVLFHCHAGKDRTGTIATVLLMLVGVSDEDIIADYSITYAHLYEEICEYIRGGTGVFGEFEVPAYENISGFLERFYDVYGSAEDYLKGIGITDDEIKMIKAKFVEDI